MAFRFQSAVAGFATRASERLKTLEEDTKEVAKTEAGRIAQEIAEARKQRIADTLDYNTTARKLKSAYSLNDAQVYTILQGGIEEAQVFMDTVRAGAIEAKTNNQEFNVQDYAQNLFTVKDYDDVTVPGIDQQAAGYAAMRSPVSAQSLVDQAAERAGVSTKTLLGQANPDYLKSLINQQVSAAAGELTPYKGPTFGTGLPEGAGFTRATVSPEDLLGISETQARIRGLEAGAAKTEVETEQIVNLMDLNEERLAAEIENIASRTALSGAQANRLNGLLDLEIEEKEAGIALTNVQAENVAKNMQFTDAKIDQLAVDMNYTEAQTELARAKYDQALVQTDLLGVELENAPDIAAAKLAQINAEVQVATERANELAIKNEALPETIALQQDEIIANIFLKETQAQTSQLNGQKLEQEIFLNDQFGFQDRQAALDLVEAKILNEQRFGDFEEYGTALLVRNDALRDSLDEETNPEIIAQIQAEIAANNERLVTVNSMTASGKSKDSIFTSSLNETTVFNTMLNKQATALDIESSMGDLGQITMSINESQLPKLFKATNQTIEQFGKQYGGVDKNGNAIYPRGREHMIGEAQSLNAAIRDFAMRNQQRSAGDTVTVGYDLGGYGAQVIAGGEALGSKHYGNVTEKGKSMSISQAMDAATQAAEGKLKEGDTASFKNTAGREIFMVYSGGEWVGVNY